MNVNAFLWTYLVLTAFCLIGRVLILGYRSGPMIVQRNTLAWAAIFDAAFIVWVTMLLMERYS